MHRDRPPASAAAAPWLASLPLDPACGEVALLIVHQGRAAAPAEGLREVHGFHADGAGGWIAPARAADGGWGYIGGDGQWRVPPALQQARARLAELESQNLDAPPVSMAAPALDQPQQFGLFSPSSAALDALAALEPDELTPKQALEALYRLKALA